MDTFDEYVDLCDQLHMPHPDDVGPVYEPIPLDGNIPM